jgi:Uma2 family endonuclease
MNAVIQKRCISESEYLELEESSNIKHEYINGEMWAMAGASHAHNQISHTVSRLLGNHLDDTRCRVYSSDMKVKVEDKFFYPDVVVFCNDVNEGDYFITTPLIIVEVLSKNTRKTDQTIKMAAYKTLPSLQEYVLIEQDFAEVEVCRRNNNWISERYFLGDDVTFESIGLTIAVETIYQRVKNQDILDYLQQKSQATENETCQ